MPVWQEAASRREKRIKMLSFLGYMALGVCSRCYSSFLLIEANILKNVVAQRITPSLRQVNEGVVASFGTTLSNDLKRRIPGG